ncbi:MAG TPA: hypothetical protein VGN33_00085 [Leifsonia sp.]|jgi:hypothetical protein|nr:hypothetical protein [Leifsonia sp.]
MACNDLAAADQTVQAMIDRYVDDVEEELRGPRRVRSKVLSEIRDGLEEATRTRMDAGIPGPAASEAAIEEFGPARVTAHAFAGELGTARARRIVLAFLVTGPLVGIWWLFLLFPQPWRFDPQSLWRTVPVLPLVVVGIGAGLAVIAMTGHLTRWVPMAEPEVALSIAAALTMICALGDVIVLTILAANITTGHLTAPVALASIAAAASTARLALASVACYRCLRARVQLRRVQTL